MILKTHAPFAKVEKFWASLSNFSAIIVESQGHVGGIWILSTKSFFTTDIVDTTSQCATIKVSSGGHHWFVSAVYALSIPYLRHQFWDYLPTLIDTVHGARALIGDFNEICLPAKSCGELFSWSRAFQFLQTMTDYSLIDI